VLQETFVFRALKHYQKRNLSLSVYSVFDPWWVLELGLFGRWVSRRRLKKRNRRLSQSYDSSYLRNVWWTGENTRPPVQTKYHHFISFDQDPHGGKNTFFPLFYIEAVLPSMGTLERVGIESFDSRSLLATRKKKETDFQSAKFACAFINNPEPTRMAAIEELGKFGQVDVFGAFSGKPVKSKKQIAKEYKFVVCFENDLYPGYVTEKLLDAYLCDAVPIYWGDLGSEEHINRDSFINLKDFASIRDFADFVGNLDEIAYQEIYSQPLLSSIPSLEPLINALLGTKGVAKSSNDLDA
jgi:hypothetical protein